MYVSDLHVHWQQLNRTPQLRVTLPGVVRFFMKYVPFVTTIARYAVYLQVRASVFIYRIR